MWSSPTTSWAPSPVSPNDTNGNGLLDLTAVAGQQTSIGTVSANDATNPSTTVTDANPANYFGDATQVDLSVTMTDGMPTVVPGTSDTYTITVSNNGPSTVSSLTLTDAIPAALLNASFTPSVGAYDPATGVWSGLSLASGQSVRIMLRGVIDPNATGTISNTVTVFAPAGVTETNPVNNVATDTDTLTPFTPNPSPTPGTTADMILRASNTSPIAGQYEIYDIGNNAILAANFLGQVGPDFQFAGLGSFFGSDTTDMLLRNSKTGGFEVYDISNNNITNAAALGTVGLDFQVAGFGDFNQDGSTDMILRNRNTGQFELYNIRDNAITSASNLGTVGLDFQVAGFGD
jgi:uncharacterized repeat protein (TIGR01451 family)